MNDVIKSIVLGIVEGVTEFLPVSSTGHMRLLEHWIGEIGTPDFSKTFDIVIQIGAIFAVVVYFRAKIADLLGLKPAVANPETVPTAPAEPADTKAQKKHVLWMIALGTLPLAPGVLFAKKSEKFFEAHPTVEPKAIAAALIIGGILMMVIEILPRMTRTRSMEAMSWQQAVVTGAAQILAAVFPGTSRSAATIMTGMVGGMDRATAAEYSFFLAIPAMFGAMGVKMLKIIKAGGLTLHGCLLLLIGTIVAFMVAYVVIAMFMSIIRKYTFVPFGLYRIVLGALVLLLL